MNYTIRRGILIKAHRQFVWNILSDFSNKYFSHVAYVKSGTTVNVRPIKVVNNKLIAWETNSPGDLELDRYKDIAINRSLRSVTYHVQSSRKHTWVDIEVKFSYPGFKFYRHAANYFALKDVLDDNLIWLKTLVEDRFEHIYDKDLFFRKDLDNAYNSIISIAREARYLS